MKYLNVCGLFIHGIRRLLLKNQIDLKDRFTTIFDKRKATKRKIDSVLRNIRRDWAWNI